MKRMTATLLLITAVSAPALAETPAQREMHSWTYVQSVANPAPAPTEAPVMDHHESRPYYHHESNHHMGSDKTRHMHHHKHAGKHPHHAKKGEGKMHHKGKHHHHHHTMKSTKATDASGSGTASKSETK